MLVSVEEWKRISERLKALEEAAQMLHGSLKKERKGRKHYSLDDIIATSTMNSDQATVGTIIKYNNQEFTIIEMDKNGVTIKRDHTEIVTRLGLDPRYQGIVRLHPLTESAAKI